MGRRVEELPTEIRAELFPWNAGAGERESLFAEALAPSKKRLYDLLIADVTLHVDADRGSVRHDVISGTCRALRNGIERDCSPNAGENNLASHA